MKMIVVIAAMNTIKKMTSSKLACIGIVEVMGSIPVQT